MLLLSSTENIRFNFIPSCERLKPVVKTLIGPHQCGFISGKFTIDQIFTLRQILEKTHEKQVDTHHPFVNYKVKERVFAAMSALDLPAKLIRLRQMPLTNPPAPSS